MPAVRAGLKGRDRSDLRISRGVIFQVVVEERAQDILAEPRAGVRTEADGSEGSGVLNLLPVMPGTEDKVDLVLCLVERLDGLVDGVLPSAFKDPSIITDVKPSSMALLQVSKLLPWSWCMAIGISG